MQSSRTGTWTCTPTPRPGCSAPLSQHQPVSPDCRQNCSLMTPNAFCKSNTGLIYPEEYLENVLLIMKFLMHSFLAVIGRHFALRPRNYRRPWVTRDKTNQTKPKPHPVFSFGIFTPKYHDVFIIVDIMDYWDPSKLTCDHFPYLLQT